MVEKGVTSINEIKTDACYLGDSVTVIYKNIVTKTFWKLQNAKGDTILGKSSEELELLVQGWELCPAVANCQTQFYCIGITLLDALWHF